MSPSANVDTNYQMVKNQMFGFVQADLGTKFINPYLNSPYEYSVTLQYKDGSYSLKEVQTKNQVDNVNISFDDYSMAAFHNHPGGNPPSLKDVFALAAINSKNQSFESSFIVTRDTNFYVLHVENEGKAQKFNNDYQDKKNELEMEFKNNLAWLISNGGYYPEKEWNAYALVGVLQRYDSGIVMLQSNRNKEKAFKQLGAEVQMEDDKIKEIIPIIYK